ncbi:MAG: hypothetical protein GY839_12350 [candidate division Zixibacteria bacterium]|nr:hypothetical protein [candidate division Zixibacteria bacterium]
MNGYVFKLIKSIMRSILSIIRDNRGSARMTAIIARHVPAVGLSIEEWPNEPDIPDMLNVKPRKT